MLSWTTILGLIEAPAWKVLQSVIPVVASMGALAFTIWNFRKSSKEKKNQAPKLNVELIEWIRQDGGKMQPFGYDLLISNSGGTQAIVETLIINKMDVGEPINQVELGNFSNILPKVIPAGLPATRINLSKPLLRAVKSQPGEGWSQYFYSANMEIIVVDHCGTRWTAKWVKRFAPKPRKRQVIHSGVRPSGWLNSWRD